MQTADIGGRNAMFFFANLSEARPNRTCNQELSCALYTPSKHQFSFLANKRLPDHFHFQSAIQSLGIALQIDPVPANRSSSQMTRIASPFSSRLWRNRGIACCQGLRSQA